MKLADAFICWTPDSLEYPPGMRGKLRVFPATAGRDELAPFPCRGGRCDPEAHDPRPETRQAYALRLALVMTQRDGLEVAAVDRLMLSIDEYAAVAPALMAEEA